MPDGSSLKDGQMISLLTEGHSLSSHKIQDQDDLGTCYANTTSVVLKSVLPGNPDISYLHLAVQSKTLSEIPSYTQASGRSFIEAGKICDAVESIKKIGGACTQQQSFLESNRLSPSLQAKTLRNLGEYFDALNKAKSNPAELEKWKNNVALTFEAMNEERLQSIINCESQKKSGLPLNEAVSKFLNNQYLNMVDGSTCSNQRLTGLKKLTDNSSVFEKDRADIKARPEAIEGLSKSLLADPVTKEAINKYSSLNPGKVNRLDELDAQKAIGKKVSAFFDLNIGPKSSIPSCADHKDKINYDHITVGDTFIRSIKSSRSQTCAAIDNKSALAAVTANNKCIDPTTLKTVLSAVTPLMELGLDIDKRIQGHLANTNPTSAGQLKNILMPGCYKQENLVSSQNLSCTDYIPCPHYSYSTKTGPSSCTDMSTAVRESKRMIFQGLANNRALGISVCTSFMKDPFSKTGFCKNKKSGVEDHEFHSMTVSGLRCAQGKVEYQLVNSWGKDDCPSAASLPNSPVKCDLKNGEKTGRFWASEEVLIDSTIGLSEIKNGGK